MCVYMTHLLNIKENFGAHLREGVKIDPYKVTESAISINTGQSKTRRRKKIQHPRCDQTLENFYNTSWSKEFVNQ